MAASMSSAQEPGLVGKGCGDCAVEKVLTEGLCKQEFLAFDSCYDQAVEHQQDEEGCLHLFDKFRECMKKRAVVDKVVTEAMG